MLQPQPHSTPQVQQVVAETRELRGAAVDRAGCVVSFPGTPAQQLHTDGAPLTRPDPTLTL